MQFVYSPYYHNAYPDYPWDKKLEEFRDQARLIEQAGFSAIWFAEHHFAYPDGWNNVTPNPILAGADLAAHTTKLRIGQCGVSLPDWHPLRVAEDIAMLDQMSKGRVDFGVMRGLRGRWDVQFNTSAGRANNDRNYALFAESLDIIIKAWTEEAFSHHGEFYTFPVPGWKDTNPYIFEDPPWGGGNKSRLYYGPERELIALGVHPKPYQKPHPPIWQMADNVESHVFAAKRGLNVMCYTPPIRKIRECWAAYKETLAETQGQDIPFGQNLGVMKPMYVAKTREDAVREARQGVNVSWARPQLRQRDREGRRSLMNSGEEPTNDDLNMDWFDFLMKHDHLWVGSPEDVAEKIEKYHAELNCGYFGVWHNISLLNFDQVMRSLDLFGEQVIPRLRKAKVA